MSLRFKTCNMTRHLETTKEIIAWRLKGINKDAYNKGGLKELKVQKKILSCVIQHHRR